MGLLDKLFGKRSSGPPRERPKSRPRLEGRGEKSDTLKPTLEPKAPEKPKPVVEKIPEDIMKHIRDLSAKKGNLLNQFLNVSAQTVELQTQQRTTMDKIKNTNESINAKMKYAYGKLKLNKRTDYRWSYDGQGNFIGTLMPKPKPQPPKK